MARANRGDVFDPDSVGAYHCTNRCVRRCFLCGRDPLTGRNYDHRKRWLEERLRFLARWFAIDVLDFSIMDNHFHVILRNRPDVVALWDDKEVARRWLMLCPVRKTADGEPEEPTAAEIAAITSDRDKLAELRSRLSHISWFMRMTAERIARRANREDDVTGCFWQGRFRCTRLIDEAALLACSVYIDLNPIRAGLADSPETSEFTSARHRMEAACAAQEAGGGGQGREAGDAWLAPLPLNEQTSPPGPAPSASGNRCSDRGFLPMTLPQYLELLDWTGRRFAPGKRCTIPSAAPPILERLGIDRGNWLELTSNFGRLFPRIAGRPASIARQRRRPGVRLRPNSAHLLGATSQ